ncbi:MAG: insulinase family protein [Acidobacteriota bacterium]|nr:insulinase family protein [Acidobacteriota bacterium]
MNYFKRTAFLLLVTLVAANFSFAQTLAALAQPKQEKLLNGLKVLIWNEPKAEKVSLRLRIHSGSAFDPKDKMGTMALLADILFPDEQTRSFFEEDLEGSLEVTSNYDYLQINATAKADEFLTVLETISTAVSNPPITQENFVKVRDARLKAVEEMQKNPAYVADMAIAKRLLADFPYGRPQAGTPESLKLIERADLLTARDRFFTADNATLAITGNVKPDFAYMAARRMFGAWKKSDRLVPATFRQPDEPDSKDLILQSQEKDKIELREAIRGLARNDKDFYASAVLLKVAENRLRKDFAGGKQQQQAFIRQEAHLLPGLIVYGNSYLRSEIKVEPGEDWDVIRVSRVLTLLDAKISADEFEKARNAVLAEINQKNPADFWLDVDTFKLVSVKDEITKASAVTLTDVQKAAERLAKQRDVTIVLKNASEMTK